MLTRLYSSSTLDSFAEAVQKVCPVDERYLLLFYFIKVFLFIPDVPERP
jgi:hypothetical protein